MTGSVRKRTTSKGTKYQAVLETGTDLKTGKRERTFRTFDSKKEAQMYLNECISDYNKGRYVHPSEITVEMLCEEWMKGHFLTIKENTKRGYSVNIYNHIIPYLGKIKVQQLTTRNIQEMVNDMVENGFSARTVKYVMTNLHQILEFAVSNDYIVKNPERYAVLPRQGKYKATVYTMEELRLMLQCSMGTPLETPLIIESFTGLRKGELLALRWQDINFEKNTITVEQNLICVNAETIFTTTKTESGERTIAIPVMLTDYLKSHKIRQTKQRLRLGKEYHDNGLIVCKENGEPINPNTFSVAFLDFLKRNNLKRIRFHDLRHTHATLLLVEYNANIKAVSDRLGHSKVQTTMDFYVQSTVTAQKEAVDRLGTDLISKTG